MKHLTTKISLIALGILLIVMMFSAITSKAANGDEPVSDGEGICGFDSKNVYADKTKGLQQVMEEYHTNMNTAFNDYTIKMLQGQENASKTNTPDPNSKAPEDGECKDQDDNYSTYCVAKNLLTNETSGYMEYLKALDCRKSSFFNRGIDISHAIQPGMSKLEIDVVNLWANRMIGDEQLPEDCDWIDWQVLEEWPEWFLNDDVPRLTKRYTFTPVKFFFKTIHYSLPDYSVLFGYINLC